MSIGGDPDPCGCSRATVVAIDIVVRSVLLVVGAAVVVAGVGVAAV